MCEASMESNIMNSIFNICETADRPNIVRTAYEKEAIQNPRESYKPQKKPR